MRKSIYHIGMLAAAALAFAGCTKEDNAPEVRTHTITVVAQAEETKTFIVEGTTEASYKWADGDKANFHITENNVAASSISMSLNADATIATFTATFPDSNASEYTYSAAYYKEKSNNGNLKIFDAQSPALDSFDPTADVLVANDITASTPPASLQFALRRVVSVNKMTLKQLEEGEVIQSVEISADKALGGYWIPAGVDNNNNPVAEHYSTSGSKLTLTYGSTAVVPASGEFPVYFVCAPQDGITIGVKVVTDKNVYERNDFTSTVDFKVGVVKRFGVKLGGYGTPKLTGTPYNLVEDQDDLFDGATYIIVAESNGDYYALGEQKPNNRAAVSVTENNGVITIDNSVEAYPVIIEAVTGGYAIKDTTNNGYLYNSNTGKNYLLNKAEKGQYTTWTIAISNGVASINNVDNTARGIMGYNPNNGSPLFAAYGTIPTGGTGDLALYVDPTTAVVLNDPNLSFSPTSVNVAWADKDSFVAPTLTIPSELTATYSSSAEGVATVDASTGAITFVGNGTTTITATTPKTGTYKAGSASYTLIVTGAPSSPGESVDNPLDAAAAIAIMEQLGQGVTSTDNYYVAGTIDAAPSYFGSGKLTFTFADASSNQIKAYNCLGLNGANFSGLSDLAIGDGVVVYGKLEKYNATTYEVINGQLAKLDHPLATPAITFTQPSQTGCSFTVKVEGNSINSGDTVEEGKTVDLVATVGADFIFNGWTVTGATVADASATTTSFTVGSSAINISASFLADVSYSSFAWDLSTDNTASSSSSQLSWYYRGVTMTVGGSVTAANNYCPPSQNSTRFYSGATLTITPYTASTIGYVEFVATTANYANALANSTWSNASASVSGTTVTVTPTDGDSAISASIGATCGFTDVTVYYTGDLAEIVSKTITITQPTETGCSISVSVNGNTISSGTSVEKGKTVSITATAGTGFTFDSWNVTGATVDNASSSSTTFVVGDSNVSIEASFSVKSGSDPTNGDVLFSTDFGSSAVALASFTGGSSYNNASTITYTASNATYVKIDTGSAGNMTSANLFIGGKSGGAGLTATIAGIKTYGATSVTVTWAANNAYSKVSISESSTAAVTSTNSASNSATFTLTGSETTISLVFTGIGSNNTRVDNVSVVYN